MLLPTVGLYIYPDINPFHYSIPHIIFNIQIDAAPLFDLKLCSLDGQPVSSEQAMTIYPQGGVELLQSCDLIIIPGWDHFEHHPERALIDALQHAYHKGSKIIGLCYGSYVLAYAGLLNGKRATTHWMAETDFSSRFPQVIFDRDALYVHDQNIITSAGTGAALDCCLYVVRDIYNTQIANKVARLMVIAPHREGGQAQFIEQPIAKSSQDAQINFLLDDLRQNLHQSYTLDQLAQKAHMSTRTFSRHFKKATGMTLVAWLNQERIRYSCHLLETTTFSIDRIAELSGFKTVVHFRQVFREQYGTSPSGWRRHFNAFNV